MKSILPVIFFFLLFASTFATPALSEASPEALDNKITELVEELNDSDIIANYYTGRKLLRIGEPAVPRLIDALNHSQSRVRLASIILLEQIKDKRAVPEFMRVFSQGDRSGRERAAVALALGRMGAKEASVILVEGLEDGNDLIRSVSAASLGMLKEGDAIPPLLDLYDGNRDSEVGQVAIRVIRAIGDEGIPKFREILEKEEGKLDTRMLAIEGLGEIKSQKSRDLLNETLNSDNKYLV